jgi:RNA-directed DNA polymerase
MSKCQKMLNVHAAAAAYREGRSIRQNALAHREGHYLLKMDFADFFPSIRAADIRSYLRTHASWLVDEADFEWIVRLVCFRSEAGRELRLSIGAPSSPWLSNVIMFEFDEKVSTACASAGVVYTRYADDVTFSSPAPDALRRIEVKVRRIVAELETPKLVFNPKKTIMLSRRMQRR